ncbi:uncharacterized protein C1orf189 homolog [Amblyraja radiata]|uniref:uncharacterized protein C1orf189 homolog n=1 Tax=Amblyraja radiata TaxID=386614 RepID=UPI00140214F4|nr:uncharacterized protein C1orf189 homolog [Amblyraja radiata]
MCSKQKGRARQWQENMKRHAEVEQLEAYLSSWRKVLTNNINLKAMEATSKAKITEQQLRTIDREVKVARRAILLMRQAALKELLQDESKQYVEELKLMGKTFYKERL